MGWDIPKLNYQLGQLNAGMKFLDDILSPKKEGESKGEQISRAGINLFGNAQAIEGAYELRRATGNNMGFFGVNAAKGDGAQALKNVTEASLWTAQMENMMYGGYGMGMGCYGPGMRTGGMWDSMTTVNFMGPGFGSPRFPGTRAFNQSFFHGGWG